LFLLKYYFSLMPLSLNLSAFKPIAYKQFVIL